MSGETLRAKLKVQPFSPFEIHMSSGDVYQITHAEQVFVTGANVFIWYPVEPGDHVVQCSLLHITGTESTERRPRKKGSKP